MDASSTLSACCPAAPQLRWLLATGGADDPVQLFVASLLCVGAMGVSVGLSALVYLMGRKLLGQSGRFGPTLIGALLGLAVGAFLFLLSYTLVRATGLIYELSRPTGGHYLLLFSGLVGLGFAGSLLGYRRSGSR